MILMSGLSKLKTLKLKLGKHQGWRFIMIILTLLVIAWLITLGLWSWFFAKRKTQQWIFNILSTLLWGWLIIWRAKSIDFLNSFTGWSPAGGSDQWYLWKSLIVIAFMLSIGFRAFKKRDWLSDPKKQGKTKRHIAGLFSWFGTTLCLIGIVLLPGFWLKLISIVLLALFLKLGTLYNPPVLELWVISVSTTPLGGLTEDGKSWWLNGKGWLEGGRFHWTKMISWLWFVNVTVFDWAEDAEDWKTPYLPTKAVKVIHDTDSTTGPARVGSGNTQMEPVARGVDVEINGVWTSKLKNPKKFMQLTLGDQENSSPFLAKLRNTDVATHLHTQTIVDVQDEKFLEDGSREVAALKAKILKASGVEILTFDVGDRNEDPDFKAEQTAYAVKQAELRQAEMEVLIQREKGKAQGQAVVSAIDQIEDALKTGDKAKVLQAYTLLEAMKSDNKIVIPTGLLEGLGGLLGKNA